LSGFLAECFPENSSGRLSRRFGQRFSEGFPGRFSQCLSGCLTECFPGRSSGRLSRRFVAASRKLSAVGRLCPRWLIRSDETSDLTRNGSGLD
jgi:hypothetical protein